MKVMNAIPISPVGIESTDEDAETKFTKYIKEQITVDSKGNTKDDVPAFEVNLKTEYKKDLEAKNLPVFIATLDDGSKKTILPLRGKGLWGPIWGYLSLEENQSTIFGAVFDHKAETPGLGADINKSWFEDQYKGKELFEGQELVSITAHKGGKGAAANAGDLKHGVDAISGGTITSKGLEEMMKEGWFFGYKEYLSKNKK